jgi:hypothetical protein
MTSRSNLFLTVGLAAVLGFSAAACNKSENKPAPEAEKAEAKAKPKSKPKIERPKEPPTILPRVSMDEPRTESGDAPVPEELEAEAADVIPPDNLEAELDNLEAEILGGG